MDLVLLNTSPDVDDGVQENAKYCITFVQTPLYNTQCQEWC